MQTTYIVIGAVIVIALAAAYFAYPSSYSSPAQAPQRNAIGNVSSSTGAASPEASPAPTPAAAPAPASSSAPTVPATVTFTDANGFSPNPVTISAGDTVTFINNGSGPIRVASDPHPIHNGYPTTGGCVGSTFDSCASIAPGASWSFTFDIKGSWGYHNHFNPAQRGKVIVQ